jgi:hypothetical protein
MTHEANVVLLRTIDVELMLTICKSNHDLTQMENVFKTCAFLYLDDIHIGWDMSSGQSIRTICDDIDIPSFDAGHDQLGLFYPSPAQLVPTSMHSFSHAS